jgi:hypothetical protein
VFVLEAIAYFGMMKTSVHYSPVSETCGQPCRGYNTGGSWRTAGLGMSREGSNTFDTGVLSGGNIVSSM